MKGFFWKAASGRIAGKGGAAERLELKRTTLQNKIRRLGSQKHIITKNSRVPRQRCSRLGLKEADSDAGEKFTEQPRGRPTANRASKIR
jgi:hypothetical protein